MSSPKWISFCCGLDAVSCRAMTGRFPPVGRMGGKRAVADHVLELLGDWPREWLMVDSDPSIVEFWRLAFAGELPAVAEVISRAPLDGKELWKAWAAEPVPDDPIERLARWAVLQKGNFKGKPLSWSAGRWSGVSGYARIGSKGTLGMSSERVAKSAIAAAFDRFRAGSGMVLQMDLSSTSPTFSEGDLVTVDPPYVRTTDYGSQRLTRDRVVELAKTAAAAGARVLVHEREPLFTGGPWRAVELERRYLIGWDTFAAAGAREFVTFNFQPWGQRQMLSESAVRKPRRLFKAA